MAEQLAGRRHPVASLVVARLERAGTTQAFTRPIWSRFVGAACVAILLTLIIAALERPAESAPETTGAVTLSGG